MFTGKKKAACAAMLSLAMVAPLAAFAENETRVITCGTLNLRAEESASSAILGKYGWGTEVLVKGRQRRLGERGCRRPERLHGTSSIWAARARPIPPPMSRRTAAA
ncbi:MAG: hypothetical protein ACLR4A_15870 [Christensenellales bacterium]